MAVVADTSVPVDYLAGVAAASVCRSLMDEVLVIPPIVVAELIPVLTRPTRNA